MEPISMAIIAALTTSVTQGVTKIGEKSIVDGYEALKALLKKKFGEDSDIAKAVEDLEKKPDSTPRQDVLKEEINTANAEKDPELLQAAEVLLSKIKDTPGGQTIVTQLVTGDGNIFTGTGDITVTKSPKH